MRLQRRTRRQSSCFRSCVFGQVSAGMRTRPRAAPNDRRRACRGRLQPAVATPSPKSNDLSFYTLSFLLRTRVGNRLRIVSSVIPRNLHVAVVNDSVQIKIGPNLVRIVGIDGSEASAYADESKVSIRDSPVRECIAGKHCHHSSLVPEQRGTADTCYPFKRDTVTHPIR